MKTCRRLFQVEPSSIVEHPTGIASPVNCVEDWEYSQEIGSRFSVEMSVGPIEGWECYALSMSSWGEDKDVIGPFDAVIESPYKDGDYCITVKENNRTVGIQYWYRNNGKRVMWYQSGHTLRFIKKQKSSD